MNTARYKIRITLHVLWCLQFIRIFDIVAPDAEVSALTSDQLRLLYKNLWLLSGKRSWLACYWGSPCWPAHAHESREQSIEIHQLVVKYIKSLDNIVHGNFRNDNTKKIIVHLTEALYPPILKSIVVKDLEYRQNVKRDVKAYIEYAEEQNEYIDRSREVDLVYGKRPKNGRKNSNSSKNVQPRSHERHDETKKGWMKTHLLPLEVLW